MPIRSANPFRVEDFQSGPLGLHRYYFLYSPASGKWLSTHTETYSCGRNTTPGTGFMRMANNVTMSSTRGYSCIHTATLVWYGATASTASTDRKFRVYNNGSIVTEILMTGGVTSISGTLDIDIAAGSVSVDMANVSPGIPAGGDTPEFQIAWRWRLS